MNSRVVVLAEAFVLVTRRPQLIKDSESLSKRFVFIIGCWTLDRLGHGVASELQP